MEAVNLENVNPFADLSIPELIDTRKEIMEARAKLAAEDRVLKADLDAVDDLLIAYHEDNPEVSQVRGTIAKVSWSEETHYNVDAGTKEETRDWLFANGHQYLMTWHLNRASTEEFIRMHGELPNVTPYVKKKVSCTKL